MGEGVQGEPPGIPRRRIPFPQGIKTGLTVIRAKDNWVTFRRTTYLKPNTDFYVVSSMPSNERYKDLIWNDPPPNFRDYPKRQTVDCLPAYMIVISPYYIPENVTHGFYSIDYPLLFRDGGNNYNLVNIVSEMFDANPYEEKTPLKEYQTPQLGELIEQLEARVTVINEDIENAIGFVDKLEETFFTPNADMWDTQDELVMYKESMEDIRTDLSKVEMYLLEIYDWDFSSISYILEAKMPASEGSSPATKPSTPPSEPPPASDTLPDDWKLVYENDLSNATSGWRPIVNESVESRYEDGKYHITCKKYDWWHWFTNRNTGIFTDFAIEADARINSESKECGYGMVFRFKDNDNFYLFAVLGNGHYEIRGQHGGTWFHLIDGKTNLIAPGTAFNHLKVVCKGSQIEAYANGHHLATVEDTKFVNGLIGLVIYSNEPGTRISFDNIKLLY